MNTTFEVQTIIEKIREDFLDIWLETFLIDRRSQNLSESTLRYYHNDLMKFSRYCEGQAVSTLRQITPDVVRRFLLWLKEAGHNAGGIHGHYRAVRAFLIWYEMEAEPDNWPNPIHKVKAPKVGKEILEPVSLEVVNAMLKKCGDDVYGVRDTALILFLLDTGARASEVCAMDITDINTVTGEGIIKHGKGDNERKFYLGSRSRKALRTYLRVRKNTDVPLFIGRSEERLTYWGLNHVVKHRAKLAKVDLPSCHSFRRAFAINCLRAGMNIYTLKELMGHEDLQVLQRYLKVTDLDTESAHRRYAPVDNLLSRKERK